MDIPWNYHGRDPMGCHGIFMMWKPWWFHVAKWYENSMEIPWNFCVKKPWAISGKVKIHQYFLQRKCRPKNLVLAVYHLWRYWQGIAPSESVKVRHSSLASENLTISWKRCKIGGKLVLITSRIWAFDWYLNRWPWMTLNGLIALTAAQFHRIR